VGKVIDYIFENAEIQARWKTFYPETWKMLRALKAKMPNDINTRTKDIESIIEWIMTENEKMADLVAQIGQFRDVAYSEAMMKIYEEFPKQSTTLIKAESDGLISQVTYLLAYAENLWKMLERNGMLAQSLLRRQP
jgi:hypothetical protein